MAPPWMAMFPPSMRKGLPTSWSEVHNLAWRIPLHDKGHSSPVILDGKIWLTAASPDGGRMFVLGIDEETGRKQWSFRHRNYNAAIRPLWLPEEGLMVVNTGFRGAHLVALKLDASTRGDITDSHVIWDRSKGNPRFAMPVYHRGLIFQISDIGVVNCIDAVTGNEIWKARVSGDYRGSPILVGEHIYFFSEQGQGTILKATRDYEEVAVNSVPGMGTTACPAVSRGAIFVRGKRHLYKIAVTPLP